LYEWEPLLKEEIIFSEMLKNCDAYIATGSNNSARYFEQYFGKYPNIIRKNRTSIAIIDGTETEQELQKLANDVYQYFGLGCRNVTKIYVPEEYNFELLLNTFRIHHELKNHGKYANNLDYNLALYILNNKFYMSNESLLMVENEGLFSPISVLHYEFYKNIDELNSTLKNNQEIQTIVGHQYLPFGSTQTPIFIEYADGIDTLKFLTSL
jgi:hypothetical protein